MWKHKCLNFKCRFCKLVMWKIGAARSRMIKCVICLLVKTAIATHSFNLGINLSKSSLSLSLSLTHTHTLDHCWLYLCRVVWPSLRPPKKKQKLKQTNKQKNKCLGYGTKLHLMARLQLWSFGECELSLHYHYCQDNWPKMVISVRVPSMDQIELFNHLNVYKHMTDVKLNC